jgi:hypothetical protein
MGRRHVRPRVVLVVALAVIGLVGVASVVGLNAFRAGRLPFSPDGCDVTAADGVIRLAPDQAANAATIVAVGVRAHVPERGVAVALATALQESKLHNLASGDRDSIGLFQQRPSQGWGRPDQLQDPRYASHAFYARLNKVPGWQSLPITKAAQAVQRSGSPDSYTQWESEAIALADVFTGHRGGAVACHLRSAASPTPTTATIGAAIRADIGGSDLSSPVPGTNRWTTTSGGTRESGWRVAQWFVAQSPVYDVRRVQYGDREWTRTSGRWQAAAHPADPATVVADLGP